MSSIGDNQNSRIPKVGDLAPDFTLDDQNGDNFTLSEFRGKFNVVIAFYPGDFTPICSQQIPNYKRDLHDFRKSDAIVLGISVDSVDCHKAWSKTFGGLNFPILADYYPHGAVAEQYGVLSENGYAMRGIFVIDKQGIIRYVDIHDIAKIPDNKDVLSELSKLQS